MKNEAKIGRFGLLLGAVGLLSVSIAPVARADQIAAEFSGGTLTELNPETDGETSLGWSFKTNKAILVTALDAFDTAGSGTVRLYDATGTTLATATLDKFASTAQTEGTPTAFFTKSITPVLLAADTTYFVAEDILGDVTGIEVSVTGLTTASAITFEGGVSVLGAGADPLTDALFGGGDNPGIFGPNFDFALAATAVPEPASLAMLLAGLVGVGFLCRRRSTVS